MAKTEVNVLAAREDMEKLENDFTLLKITYSDEIWFKNPSNTILFYRNGLKHYHFAIKHGEFLYFAWLGFKKATFYVTGIYVIMPFKDFDPSKFYSYTRKEITEATKQGILAYDSKSGERVMVRIKEIPINFYFWRTMDEQKFDNLCVSKQEREFLFKFEI
jgi:hypothetical protein